MTVFKEMVARQPAYFLNKEFERSFSRTFTLDKRRWETKAAGATKRQKPSRKGITAQEVLEMIREPKTLFRVYHNPLSLRLSWNDLIKKEISPSVQALEKQKDLVLVFHGFNYLPRQKETLKRVEFAVTSEDNTWTTRALCPGDQWETKFQLRGKVQVALDSELDFGIPTISLPTAGPINAKASADVKAVANVNFILSFLYEYRIERVRATGISNNFAEWRLNEKDFSSNVALAALIEIPKGVRKVNAVVSGQFIVDHSKRLRIIWGTDEVPYDIPRTSLEIDIP